MKCSRMGSIWAGSRADTLSSGISAPLGDGLVAALQILRIMKLRGEPLSKLVKCWTRFPQLVTNIKVRRNGLRGIESVPGLLAEAEVELESTGWPSAPALLRTEPKARLLVEGRETAVLEKCRVKSGCDQAPKWARKGLGNSNTNDSRHMKARGREEIWDLEPTSMIPVRVISKTLTVPCGIFSPAPKRRPLCPLHAQSYWRFLCARSPGIAKRARSFLTAFLDQPDDARSQRTTGGDC